MWHLKNLFTSKGEWCLANKPERSCVVTVWGQEWLGEKWSLWVRTQADGSCFSFCPQVLQDRGSSPSTRSMPTLTTCPKPTPGERHSRRHTHTHTTPHPPSRYDDRSSLLLSVSPPSSFNRIDIPPYESYDKLYDKLLTAIEETCGFAVEWETRRRECVCACVCLYEDCWLESSSSLAALHILPRSVCTAARAASILLLFVFLLLCSFLICSVSWSSFGFAFRKKRRWSVMSLPIESD